MWGVSFSMDILNSMDWTNVAEVAAGILLAAIAIGIVYLVIAVAVYVTH